MTTRDWLSDLNPQQRAAAMHGDGPLLVIAGAGTGKTKTLAARANALRTRRSGFPAFGAARFTPWRTGSCASTVVLSD